MLVTCENPDCENQGAELVVVFPTDEAGQPSNLWVGVECGICGTMIYRNPGYVGPDPGIEDPPAR